MKPLISAVYFLLAVMPHVLMSADARAETSPVAAVTKEVVGTATDPVEKTRRLVNWLHKNLEWSYTDYQKRTVSEILTRRAGNCAELAGVLRAMLNESAVRSRWVAEINIHPETPTRQATAARKVAESGNRMSVFGLRHNDHRWLEVFDEANGSWVPADPSMGIVGTEAWVRARLAFSDRLRSPIPAVEQVARNMIVPIVVLAMQSGTGNIADARSEHYLVDAFNALYGGKLSGLASWPRWRAAVGQMVAAGSGAFEGRANLHQQQHLIDEASDAYEALRREAAAAGIAPVSAGKTGA